MISAKSGAQVRIEVSQVWRWVSMKPGITMSPVASIDPRALGRQVLADGRDLVVLDQDVGAGHLAELRVLGQDDSHP